RRIRELILAGRTFGRMTNDLPLGDRQGDVRGAENRQAQARRVGEAKLHCAAASTTAEVQRSRRDVQRSDDRAVRSRRGPEMQVINAIALTTARGVVDGPDQPQGLSGGPRRAELQI